MFTRRFRWRAQILCALAAAMIVAGTEGRQALGEWNSDCPPDDCECEPRVKPPKYRYKANKFKGEKKPKVKRIADPKNLESGNKAIKRAAEIKQQEDLKPQKIKAAQYLASMGCGCYNEDKSITVALLAALKDCTEEVRLATIEAIAQTAAQPPCTVCGKTSCCDPDIVKKLAQMAWERDAEGCPLEPSEKVRQAAAKAACICCPGGPGPEVIKPPPPPPPGQTLPPIKPPPLPPSPESGSGGAAPIGPKTGASVIDVSSDLVRPAAFLPQEDAVGTPTVNEKSVPPLPVAPVAVNPGVGTVRHVDSVYGFARVEFGGNCVLPKGTLLQIEHQFRLARLCTVVQVEVVDSAPGTASVRPVDGSRISKVTSGDPVVLVSNGN